MKILQVCRIAHKWGMDLFAETTKAYPNDDVTTVVLAGHKDDISDYHGKVLFFDFKHDMFWRYKAFWRLLKLSKKEKFDVVICHHHKPTLIMHYVSLFCPIKKLYSIHHNFGNYKRKISRACLYFMKKRWKFITVSNALKQEFIQNKVPEKNIIVIHNAINIKSLEKKQLSREQARESLGIPLNSFVFGTLGRLVRDKAHNILIDSFRKLNLPNSYLVIIGNGYLEKELKEQAKNLNVLFVVDKSHQGAEHLKALDVFVFPSRQEAFGIAVLEAQCAKLPIIASTAGGIPEAVGKNNGILVKADDSEGFTRAMQKMADLSQEERERQGERNYQYLCDNFSLARYHEAFRALLK